MIYTHKAYPQAFCMILFTLLRLLSLFLSLSLSLSLFISQLNYCPLCSLFIFLFASHSPMVPCRLATKVMSSLPNVYWCPSIVAQAAQSSPLRPPPSSTVLVPYTPRSSLSGSQPHIASSPSEVFLAEVLGKETEGVAPLHTQAVRLLLSC